MEVNRMTQREFDMVYDIVLKTTGVDPRERARNPERVFARYCFTKICRELYGCSYSSIGEYLGKDHSTLVIMMKRFVPPRYLQYALKYIDLYIEKTVSGIPFSFDEIDSVEVTEAADIKRELMLLKLRVSSQDEYYRMMLEMSPEYRKRCEQQIKINYTLFKNAKGKTNRLQPQEAQAR